MEQEKNEERLSQKAFRLSAIQNLEAILFAAGDPVPLARLAEVLNLEEAETRSLLDLLGKTLASDRHGIELRQTGDSFALATKPEANDALEIFFAKPPKVINLSQAAYETLAVVAYNEPVTRAQIDSVRGVNSDGALNRLIEKGLVEMSGTLDLPGRPSVFKTTELFLRLYGIRSLDELEPIDMLMYGTVRDFEQSYQQTRALAAREEEDDQSLAAAGIDLGTVDGESFRPGRTGETAGDKTAGEEDDHGDAG